MRRTPPGVWSGRGTVHGAPAAAPLMAHTQRASMASKPHFAFAQAMQHPLEPAPHDVEQETSEAEAGTVTGEGQFTAK